MTLEILNNTFLKPNYLLLELRAPSEFAKAKPGQFLHLRIEDSCDPLLRRPLSIHDVAWQSLAKKGAKRLVIRVLYEVVGRGTLLLSEKRPLMQVDALGPLGQGFDIEKLSRASHVVIVAGGMGVAPLFFLAKKIAELKTKNSKLKTTVLIGARDAEHIICDKKFKDLGCEVHVATEDGSKGFKGRVTELLSSLLPRAMSHELPAICACGPKPMLAAVARIAQKKGLTAQVSLEEFMGCGLGACLGCVIRTTSGYRRICHDGPVFDAADVIWTE
jgi:dihydroorotate dehydrogenase electron transfer subunit